MPLIKEIYFANGLIKEFILIIPNYGVHLHLERHLKKENLIQKMKNEI